MADTNRDTGRTEQQRLIGVAVPVGALRGREQSGVGEFLDLIDFAELCADMGIGLIQILPVNDTGYESSPYSALTAFGLNPLYLRLGALEEAPPFIREIEALDKSFSGETRFPYYRVLKAKMDLLRAIYDASWPELDGQAQSGPLASWIDENAWVKPYAVFRRLKESNGEKSWKAWSGYRQVTDAGIDFLWNDPALRKEHLFWAWLQRALDCQFARAAKAVRDLGIRLEGDLPILMNEDSCDVWARAGIFKQDLAAGAPPDMYSPAGQNWGFPIYDWEAQAADGYAWWKARLKAAGKYYDAYRIDHVLGFFRIWASSRADNSSALGRYVPYLPVTRADLEAAGFDDNRIRWLSRPHVPASEIADGIKQNLKAHSIEEIAAETARVFESALDRIGAEELWLFKKSITGEKDIDALNLSPPSKETLIRAWHNRLFLEYSAGEFFPVWYFRESRAYASLSAEEKSAVEALVEQRRVESEKIWEREGEKLLSVLTESSAMIPCAEDLGAVPGCVPRVLTKLGILGLRVTRWFRRWDQEGRPYVPFREYPELSVCTPSVHDSSTLREWWDTEADQETFAGFIGVPSLPRVYNPGTAKIILKKTAAAASRFRVFQLQDLLHLSQKWYADDPASERINVPGTANGFNWTWRLAAPIADIRADGELVKEVRELAAM
ncbi:MAG: 4-alpha-glucanotransferase [Treponema sp.]|jgi:4-alpha-glucanotransferase|nr:4-alpha-glucanotransferase [Treponema sp.]